MPASRYNSLYVRGGNGNISWVIKEKRKAVQPHTPSAADDQYVCLR